MSFVDMEFQVAKQIAIATHKGQTDKAGADYILHPLAVAELCCGMLAKVVAVLHDVVEDTAVTIEDLRKEGIREECLQAIDCLTKRSGESIDDYFARVVTSDIAIEVKFCDMLHNSDISRFPSAFDKAESARLALRYAQRIRMLAELVGHRLDGLSATVRDAVRKKIALLD